MKTAEDFYLQVTGWESLESVEELDSAKDVVKMIDDFSKEKTKPLIEMLKNYLSDLNNLVPISQARENRIIQVKKLIGESPNI